MGKPYGLFRSGRTPARPRPSVRAGRPLSVLGWTIAALVLLQTVASVGLASDLTLADAVGLALAQHPRLQSAQAAIQREQGETFQAGRRPNPTVGYSSSEVGNEGQAGQQGVYVSQLFRRGEKIPLDVEVQRWNVAMARADHDLAICRVEVNVSQRFLAAALAQRRLALRQRRQANLDKAVERTDQLVAGGFLKRPVLLSLRLQARRHHVTVEQQQRAADTALWRLGAAMSVDASPAAVATDLLEMPAQSWDFETLWADLRARSPQRAKACAEHQRSLWVVRRQDVEPIGDVNTQLTMQHDTSTDTAVVGIQVGVEVPVHDRNRGARSAARADTRRSHTDVQAIELQLRGRLAEVFRRHEAARQYVEASRRELQPLAAENLTVVKNAYDNNEATVQELLDAQQAEVDLQLTQLQAQHDLALAMVDLHTCLVRLQ